MQRTTSGLVQEGTAPVQEDAAVGTQVHDPGTPAPLAMHEEKKPLGHELGGAPVQQNEGPPPPPPPPATQAKAPATH